MPNHIPLSILIPSGPEVIPRAERTVLLDRKNERVFFRFPDILDSAILLLLNVV